MAQQGLMRATPTGLAVATATPLVPWLLRGGFFIAVLGGSYLLLKNIILTIRRNRDLNKVGTNTPEGRAIGFASRCYAALIPSGHPWVNDTTGDGTELEDLYQVAREIHSSGIGFALVSTKYQSLYGRDLLSDVSNDLSRAEVSKFNGLLTTGLGAPVELAPLLEHDLVTTAPTVAHSAALVPLQHVPARTWLGPHAETMITAAGTFHGFLYTDHNQQEHTRFVPAAHVAMQAARR